MVSILDIIFFLNDVVQGAIVIFGASIVLYNIRYILRDRVTRAFSLLITFIVIVFMVELLVTNGMSGGSAEVWLRLGWFGIAMVPAALIHLADVLLISTGSISLTRRFGVYASYLIATVWISLAFFSDLLVGPIVDVSRRSYLEPGLLFPLFSAYLFLLSGLALWNIWRARQRAQLATTRRRLTLIFEGAIAAPFSIYPYLVVANNPQSEFPLATWIVLLVGNVTVGIMFGILTSQLVYFATTSSPARVVRVRLYKYLARVPLAATLTLAAYIFADRSSSFLGLPNTLAVGFAIVSTVILVEWAIHTFKRPLEGIFQLDNDPDIKRIQRLSERIVTSRELEEFFNSVLTTTCNALQTPTAFIVGYRANGPELEAGIGLEKEGELLLHQKDLVSIATYGENGHLPEAADYANDYVDTTTMENRDSAGLIKWNEFWIVPLRDRKNGDLLGIFGIKSRPDQAYFTEVENKLLLRLTGQAALALEDRLLQEQVFAAVEGLLPQITALQQKRNLAVTMDPTPTLAESPEDIVILNNPDFSGMVKDALSHYWGGPKLTESPLLSLQIVQEALNENEGNATKALRDILNQAIEQQKPEGDHSWTSAEWILYNILELRFLKGYKVRDVARRLAMSESDLYRKQKIAIENVARTISNEERGNFTDPN